MRDANKSYLLVTQNIKEEFVNEALCLLQLSFLKTIFRSLFLALKLKNVKVKTALVNLLPFSKLNGMNKWLSNTNLAFKCSTRQKFSMLQK